MKTGLRTALLFGAQFVPIFLVLLWLYPRVLPHYQVLPVGVANFVMQGLSTPTRIEVTEAGGWQSYFPNGQGGEQNFWSFEEFVIHLVYLNLALLPALVLATPVPWRERLRMLGLALLGLVLVHALTLVILVRAYLGLYLDPGNFFDLWLLRVAYTSGQIFAAVLWALLTWRFWLSHLLVPGRPTESEVVRPQPADN